jgi:outer membrane murein-binding lipoprotein Lpp
MIKNAKRTAVSMASVLAGGLFLSGCGSSLQKPDAAEQDVAKDEAELEQMSESGEDDPEKAELLEDDQAEKEAEVEEYDDAKGALSDEEAESNGASD